MYLFISYCDFGEFIVLGDGFILLGEMNIGYFFFNFVRKVNIYLFNFIG